MVDPLKLERVYQAHRFLEATSQHRCEMTVEEDGLCPQDRVAVKLTAKLLLGRR